MPPCSVHEVYVLVKEVTSSNSRASDGSCRREFEKACFYLLWNHPKSVMHVRSILWSVRLIIFILYVFPSTPSHWLICSRKRSSFLRACLMQGLRYPWWWFLTWTRYCFIVRILRGHACLGQRVHMYVAEPAHVLELAIVVHLPRISQCHLVDLCCNLSFSDMLSEISCYQQDLNLSQIW